MSSGSGLPPHQHAPFAVISRLLSCLVTEKLLRAFYIPVLAPSSASGILVVLATHLISEQPVLNRALRSNDIFAVVPLHHPPVFDGTSVYQHGRPVGLVDPLDMLPTIYELEEVGRSKKDDDKLLAEIYACFAQPSWDIGSTVALKRTENPIGLWNKFVDSVILQGSLRETIEKELRSSLEWQLSAYNNPPACPSLKSSPIEWEQSLVAGHPTHPMHRARMFNGTPEHFDWYHPRVRFVGVPRSNLNIIGPFEESMLQLAMTAANRAGRTLPLDDTLVFMPVHELQIKNITSMFRDVHILHADISVPVFAQSSIRTVVVPDLPGMALKLSVGVKISSSLRTISHFTADFGPRFSSEIVPRLAIDPRILSVELEPASAVYRSSDANLAKHFTAVLRSEYQPAENEALIVCAALLETDHAGVPARRAALQHVLGLDSEGKRIAFLERYIRLACDALLPPLIQNGVAFEAHAQNVLARFDSNTGELLGFVIRDLGGLRIHPQTLRTSTSVDFQFLPGHCVVTDTVEETYPKFYHTFVHNHIQRLIRLLGLHYNGRGWQMLRDNMERLIPRDHGLWGAWMNSDSITLPSKCLMRMRMRDSYSEVNTLFYTWSHR
ncbi:IucC family-domain-containing protein [Crucibulum laeve]|uniref:IucC family-domain-containing protein n=1 Tax=Crucibulum laeve TaxID=68775 RepID=A0A5C3M4F3_9AGAR|nr:IucC family-domain-containing protein [Crucibulum laeve]